jgi:protein-S-isoprenylcysteine O-methyltransferase Ste14
MSLRSRLLVRSVVALVVVAPMLFLTAGTLKFWEAWVFLGIMFLPMIIFSLYYPERDPQMVERRLQTKEKVKEQKVIMKLVNLILVPAFLITGFDHRFGWTRELVGAVPLWLRIVAQVLLLAGYLVAYWVVDVNRFASRTIQVEPGQKVISSGPYSLVRHPMYSAGLVMWLFVPVALASYVALPLFAIFIPIFVWRLLNEERVLKQELPGYEAYCQKTRFRLIPHVW